MKRIDLVRVGLLLGATVVASACGGDFNPASRLTGLRVLAVRATKGPPGAQVDGTYARPGERVTLDALWYDKKGRTLTWAWTVCVRPLASTVLGCFQKIAADAVRTRTPPPFDQGPNKDGYTFTIPPDALDGLAKEAQPGAIVGVVTAVCPGTLTIIPQVGKNDLPLSCKDADGNQVPNDDFILGFKRIFLRTTDQNQNPIVTGLTVDGKTWEAGPDNAMGIPAGCGGDENRFDRCGGDEPELRPLIDPRSFEAGTDEFGTPFTEQLVVQYYAEEGLFESDVRRGQEAQTKFRLRQGKLGMDGKLVHLWVVVRDNRGGVTWLDRWAKPR